MRKHKALLIQDIREYISLVKTTLAPHFSEHHVYQGLTEDFVVEWIIAKEIENNYLLFTRGHDRNLLPHLALYALVDHSLPVPLSQYTQHYVKAPHIYGDNNEISMRIKGCDLYIFYYRNDVPFSTHNAFAR